MRASGTMKHRQQVLVRFKAAKATLSSDVQGHIEYVRVCKGQAAARETITFVCLF